MSEPIDIRMTRARSILVTEHPFFGALAMRLVIIERPDIRTLATDAVHLFYNREFLSRITETELVFCVAHEVLHCALSHMTRRNERRWDLWQAATDYVVNLMLHQAGLAVPKWAKYFNPKYTGYNVEEIYARLENEEKESQQEPDESPQETMEPVAAQQAGSGGDPDDDTEDDENGNGADAEPEWEPDADTEETDENAEGDPGKPGKPGDQPTQYPPSPGGDPRGCGEVLDAAPPHDKAKADEISDEWQVYTRQAANVARRAGEGKLPGFIEELIEILDEPQINWHDTLRRFVDPQTSNKDYSWRSPNRRMMGLGYYVPGLISDGVNHIGFCVDSSGSVDSERLRQVGADCQGALDEGVIEKLTLVFCDDGVHRTAEYVKGDVIDFTVQGRGGTNYIPALEWMNANAPDVSAVIYFTDLECSSYGPPPTYPVLWMAHGPDPRTLWEYAKGVPFGEVVLLTD